MRTLQSEALDGKFLPVRGVELPKKFLVSAEIMRIHEEIAKMMKELSNES